MAWGLNADPPRVPTAGATPTGKADGPQAVPVAVARDRARLLHEVYTSTLDAMHHHFFRRERAVLPARAMDDVFADVDRRTGVRTRWIAVNTPAMSIDHEPGSAFEKKASAALAAGRAELEATEPGLYYRATPVPLGAGCVGCHTKFGSPADKTPRLAGLVVTVPVTAE